LQRKEGNGREGPFKASRGEKKRREEMKKRTVLNFLGKKNGNTRKSLKDTGKSARERRFPPAEESEADELIK